MYRSYAIKSLKRQAAEAQTEPEMTDAEKDAERAEFNRRNPDAPSAVAEHYWR